MENKMKRPSAGLTIAILAFLIAVAGGLAVLNSFRGNPLSASRAQSQIEAYVKATYPAIRAEIQPVRYNFKNGGSYAALVQAVDSPDTVFWVTRKGSGQLADDYQQVTMMDTTFERLEKEMNTTIERLIAEQFPYETRLVGATLQETEIRTRANALKRDMKLDLSHPPLPLGLVVWCSAEAPSYQVLADRLLELQGIMEHNGIPISFYSVNLEHPYVENDGDLIPKQWDSVTVLDLPAERLQEKNLPAVLKDYREERERSSSK